MINNIFIKIIQREIHYNKYHLIKLHFLLYSFSDITKESNQNL